MAANTHPIYTETPVINSVQLATGNARSNGGGTIGTDMFLIAKAGLDGAYISSIRFMPWASVAGTATTATVIRIYTSTIDSGATTSADTFLYKEISVAAQTADSTTAGVYPIDEILNMALPAGMTILCSIHATPAANTGWAATGLGGGY